MIRQSLSVCALVGGWAIASTALAQFPSDLGELELTAPQDFAAEVAVEEASEEAPPAKRRPGFSSYVWVGEAPKTADVAAEILGQTEPVTKETPKVELTPALLALNDRIDRTLNWYYDHPENVADRSVWGVMHNLIAFGVDTQVVANDRKVNAIGWVCYNGPCKGQRLFYLQNGQLTPKQGPGVQGHHGQFLAMLAQSRVKSDFPIRVEGKDFTVADLIEFEKRTCQSKTELTFKLIGLAHYLQSDETWKNDRGETWSIPKLINEELAQPIVGAACGGSHRLTGFSYAVNKRTTRDEAFTGEWLRAKKYEDSYHDYIIKLQNPDGSFSSQWFAGRADYGGDLRKLETTGHMTEWLVYSLPKEQLTEPQVVKAVDFLNDLMWRNRGEDLKIGPKGHALHALVIYQEKLFDAKPGMRNARLATQGSGRAGK